MHTYIQSNEMDLALKQRNIEIELQDFNFLCFQRVDEAFHSYNNIF